MRNELSKRLQAVADLVTVRECVADIGTDHAYIPIYLTEHKKVKKAFAMDVNEGPLIRAEEHVREAGLKEQIKMRRSNGLEKLSPEKWKPSLSRYGRRTCDEDSDRGTGCGRDITRVHFAAPVGDRKGAGISSAERLSDRAGRDGTG
ncbi:MAG: class I SAM-dependent methyltransferase [Mediterraneibacter gnavus]